MKKFKVLRHKADMRIKAFAKTKEGLFSNMLEGMAENQEAKIEKGKKTKKKIKIESLNLNALLVDFLSEALYLSRVNMAVYNKVEFNKFTDIEIEGRLMGNKVESFGEDIKAVTYYGLDIKQKENGAWEAIVIFDV